MSKAKAKPKKPAGNIEKLRKEALAVTTANLARIEAHERGEKPTADGSAKPAKAKTAKAAKPKKEKRMSGLDAAAKVLAETKKPLNAQAIVEAMSTKGYWTSPGGKTPHATIYAAMIREIKDKGREARFVKKDRGLFAAAKGA
jgi:hypothetical protein